MNASVRSNRWIDLCLTRFRTFAGVSTSGGRGFVPTYYIADSFTDSSIVRAGTNSASTTAGFGYRGRQLGASGSVAWTVTGTSADIWYRQVSGGGSFTWKIDSGSTTTVSTAGADSWIKLNVSLGSSGSHTVTVARTVGTVTIGGLMVYNNDATAGVQLYDAAVAGIRTDQYLGNAAFDAGTPEYTLFKAAVATIAPDLISIFLGVNDSLQNAQTPTQCAANLTTLITDMKALAKRPDIVLIASYDQPDGTSWSSYRTQIVNLAATQGVTLLDLYSLMPSASTTTYYNDGIHPNDAGEIQIANHFSDVVDISAGVADAPTTSATGAAPAPAMSVTVNAGTASATGSALSASGRVAASAASAAGTGAAPNASGVVSPPWGPPTGLTATTISSVRIDLTWNSREGASGYDIERDGVVIALDVVGTSYSDTGLAPGSSHTYRARSVRA
jgi:lysophospholipase L1-like esterase